MHQKKLNEAVLKTLIYSDIFDYPLTLEEIGFYLLGKFSLSEPVLRKIKGIEFFNGYFFLTGRKNIVKNRIRREEISKGKYVIAQKVIKFLSFIPTIRFIGVSGSLAMNNAEKSDDIDLFIICAAQSIWITRLFVLLIVQILGKRRIRNSSKTENAICSNMFITENAIILPVQKQNLFTAHEIVQVKPLFDRDNTYNRFFLKNEWIHYYLPNAYAHKIISQNSSIMSKVFEKILLIGEVPSGVLQYWYMRGHKTGETVTETLFAFHPQDATKMVLMAYFKKIKHYGISI